MAVIDGDARNDTLTGTDADDLIRGFAGDDWLSGLAGADRLRGGDGNDTLYGGDGSDLLIGGRGRDFMWGGSGPDSFRFDDRDAGDATAGPLSDVILDFSAEDTLDLLAVDVLSYAGFGSRTPERGTFSIWQTGGSTYVTWNLFGSLHDVELRGFTGDPYSQIRWYEDDFQGNASTTGQISLGETKAGTIEVEQDTDWFAISLEQGKGYYFDARGATDGGGTLRDPIVVLYNSEGEQINGSYEDLAYIAATTGTYYLEVNSGGSNAGTYQLAVSELVDDYASDASTTGRIAAGETVAGKLEIEGDADWFQTTLQQGRIYVFNFQGAPEASLVLYDASGDYVADGYESLTFVAGQEGTYYIEANGDGHTRGAYQLEMLQIEDDYSSDTSTTGRIAAGETVAGVLEIEGDADWFQATLEGGRTYLFNFEGAPEPYLNLYNANGKFVASGAGSLGFSADNGGIYYIEANGDFHTSGAYQVEMSEIEDDYASNTSTTGRIALGETVAGELEFAGDADWFQATLEQGLIYVFSFEGAPEPYLSLYNASGSLVTEGYGSLSFVADQEGAYYIGANGGGFTSGAYQVKLLADDYSGDASTTGRIEVGDTVAGELEYSFDRDWFRVGMVAGQTYTIDLKGVDGGSGTLEDPVLNLLDPGENFVAGNDDFTGRDSRILYTAVETGDYYIDAEGYQDYAGTYTVSVSSADTLLT